MVNILPYYFKFHSDYIFRKHYASVIGVTLKTELPPRGGGLNDFSKLRIISVDPLIVRES